MDGSYPRPPASSGITVPFQPAQIFLEYRPDSSVTTDSPSENTTRIPSSPAPVAELVTRPETVTGFKISSVPRAISRPNRLATTS